MTIADRLRNERLRLSLTQESLADAVGKSRTQVKAWERGIAVPNAEALAVMATFGFDVAYVVTGQQVENVAISAYELAYLRCCRKLASVPGGQAMGSAALVGVMSSLGLSLDTR